MNQLETVDLSPHPSALLESLRSIGYTLETALADIVDNSITAKATSISVRFLWNSGQPWIAILDNGRGMNRETLAEAMRFGCQPVGGDRSADDLGRFGLGLKTASISQARRVTVASSSDDEPQACEWDLDGLARSGSEKWNANLLSAKGIAEDPLLKSLVNEAASHQSSHTVVLWRCLDVGSVGSSEERFSEVMDQAREHLETVFHRFLSPERGRNPIRMDFNGSALTAFDPFGPCIATRQELTLETIQVDGIKIPVQPFVLPHRSMVSRAAYDKYAGKGGYLHSQGFYVYRNRRLILRATWFRLIKKEELNKLIRIRIDIPSSLDHLWGIDVKKSQANPPESVRRQLKQVIGRIEGAGKMVFTKRVVQIRQRDTVPVWRREVANGKVRYGLNPEHAILSALLESGDSELKAKMSALIKLVEASFPYEMHFADAANDETDFHKEVPTVDEVIGLLNQVVSALHGGGYRGEALKSQVLKMELPSFPTALLDDILKKYPNDQA